MAKQNSKLTTVGEILSLNNANFAVANPPLISAPYSTITDMSGATRKLPDPSKTLKPTMGLERIMVQQIALLQNEKGSNGEPVFGAMNDDSARIRFVGAWFSLLDANGAKASSSNSTSDYAEITFYGTGLNLLTTITNAAYDVRVSVDGGAEGSNIFPASGMSFILLNRNYATDQLLTAASGLTLGLHTIKLRNNNAAAFNVYGLEIIGPTSISVPQGELLANGTKYANPTVQTLAHNSGFDGNPVLNGRGGRVLIYQTASGYIGKAIQQTNSSPAYMSSADHTNEEVVRIYYPVEFGASRSDDFSAFGANVSRAFTLDDGTTTLVGSAISANTTVGLAYASSSLTLTFVGTGIDVTLTENSGSGTDSYTYSIDGAQVGAATTANANKTALTYKVASGLPYGTHTLRISKPTANSTISLVKYTVYQPKKPTIPDGAIEISDYCLMADFAALTGATASIDAIATGVLRKASNREMVYVNGTGGTQDWGQTPLVPANSTTGHVFSTDRIGTTYVEYTFFGTGFQFRGNVVSAGTTLQVNLNGVAASTTNYPTLTSSVYGTGLSYTASTGVVDFGDASTQRGAGFTVSGLPLARYTVRVTNTTASNYLNVEALDIITPIYSHKSNLYADLQNTLPVGSNSMSWSSRNATSNLTANKAWAQAVGIAANPTSSSTAEAPIPDMSVTIKASGGPVSINFLTTWLSSVANTVFKSNIYINGAASGSGHIIEQSAAGINYYNVNSNSIIVHLSAGVHKIDVYGAVNANSVQYVNTDRKLIVREL